jgi:two-component system sensor histidine kinase PilS (NtrC family)
VTDASLEVEAEMDPTHLHQIVWNLCDNAMKYASATAGAIAIEVSCGISRPPVDPSSGRRSRSRVKPGNVEEIFEPFFTGQPATRSRPLHISRARRAQWRHARYHARPGGGGLFRVVFADPDRWNPNEETLEPGRTGR